MENELIKKVNRYFHDEESDVFSARHKSRINEESRFYVKFFKEFLTNGKSSQILDIGTGTGLVAKSFLNNNSNFICTDISLNMLRGTKNELRAKSKPITSFIVCDSENLPFKAEAFDIITCNAAMHHFPDINKFAEGLYRVTAKNGALVVGFESNRKFWKNYFLSFIYRAFLKFFKKSGAADAGYSEICRKVNKRLLEDNIISKPLSDIELLEMVDLHSPNSGSKIDYSKGFDVDELKSGPFGDFKVEVMYHYDTRFRTFNFFNRLFFPKSAPKFTMILKKV